MGDDSAERQQNGGVRMKWLIKTMLPLLVLMLAGCSQTTPSTESPSAIPTEPPSAAATTVIPNAPASEKPSPSSDAIVVPEYEVELVAKTLRGECYNDQPDDKREVAKVIYSPTVNTPARR